MKTLRNLAQMVDAEALRLIAKGRIGYRELDHAVDDTDTELGSLLCAFVLNRYCERVTAGQGA